MYTDVVNINGYLKTSNTANNWYSVGYNAGDFLMRFLWSRYVPRVY